MPDVTDKDIELFNDSIERCSTRSDFLKRFYTLFLASSDVVAKKFERTDMRKQARMLKTLFYIMICGSIAWFGRSVNATPSLARKPRPPGGACCNRESSS